MAMGVDWCEEVEARDRRNVDAEWLPFRILRYSDEFPNQVAGVLGDNREMAVYDVKDWEFRNRPDEEQGMLFLVWVQYPDGDHPVVAYTTTSRKDADEKRVELHNKSSMARRVGLAISKVKAPAMLPRVL